MLVKVTKSKFSISRNIPLKLGNVMNDCAYLNVKKCKKCNERCNDYLPITPTCANCLKEKDCEKAHLTAFCRKWEADLKSPFIALVKEISQISTTGEVLPMGSFDDSDFKASPNWLYHCLDRVKFEPYPKQIQEASNFFNDTCPFCTNPAYTELFDQTLGNILDNVVFLEFGVCPKCKRNRTQIIKESPDRHWYEELCGIAGQRSGKTELVSLIASYVWEWYVKLAGTNVAKYFSLGHSTKLHMTFVALTYNQAKDTLWQPFQGHLRNNWWFQEYHKFLDVKCKELGVDPVVKFEETYILYKHKNLQCAPLGPDKRTLRGRTRFFYSIDELGWFTGSKDAVKINPDEIYNALNNSLKTIKGASKRLRLKKKLFHLPTGFACNISSPYSSRDGIMRLMYKSRKIKSIYAFHYPTWEFNPTLTEEDFEDDFAKNPSDARRDFGAFPPLVDSPYISDATPLLEMMEKTRKNIIKYTTYMVKSASNKEYVSALIDNIKFPGKPLLMGIDAGYSNNSFAIGLTSYNQKGQCCVEGIIEVKPLPGKPINFNHLYRKVIKKLLNQLNVIAVFFDRWQSIDLIQRIEEDYDGEIEAVQYSLKYGDFELIRKKILGEQVVIPQTEVKDWDKIMKGLEDYDDFFINKPISHFLLQLATVQDSGRRVEKSGDLDDDIFRALALCINFTFNDEYKYSLMSFLKEENNTGSLGVVRGISGGSSLASNAISAMAKSARVISKTSMGVAKSLSR